MGSTSNHEAAVQVVLQTTVAILWIAGLIGLVIGIYYGVSLLVLAAVSKLLPLTGRRSRSRDREASRDHSCDG